MMLDDQRMHGPAIRMSLLDPSHISHFHRFDGKTDLSLEMLSKPICDQSTTLGTLYRSTRKRKPDGMQNTDDYPHPQTYGRILMALGTKNGMKHGCWADGGDTMLWDMDGSRRRGGVVVMEAVKTVIEHAPQNSTNLWQYLENISVIEGIDTKADRIGMFQLTSTKSGRGCLAGGSRATGRHTALAYRRQLLIVDSAVFAFLTYVCTWPSKRPELKDYNNNRNMLAPSQLGHN